MRWRWLIGAAATGIAALVACSYDDPPPCPNGVWPFDGATGVPLDVVIVVQTGDALPADLPPLDGAVHLTTANGNREVPLRTEVDGPSGEIRVVPDRPLEPDTEYLLGAVDWYWRSEHPHWWGDADFGRDYTLTTFTTASRPALLAVYPSDEDDTIILAFSEAMDPSSLEIRGQSGEVDYADVPFDVLGAVDGEEHLVWITPADEPVEVRDLVVDAGRARSGASLEPTGVDLAAIEQEQFDDPLERFSGLPYCMAF